MKFITLIGASLYLMVLVCESDSQTRDQRIHESFLIVLVVGAVLGDKKA